MNLSFRNIEFDKTTEIDSWPAEAIQILLGRGSLSDWRALAHAIRANPWGPAARTTENVVGWDEHYGVDVLMQRVIRKAREDVERHGRELYAQRIKAWRKKTGMSLREFAAAAGTSAPRLSSYESGKVAPTTDVLGRLEHVAKRRAK